MESSSYSSIKIGSEKNFGIVFGIFFILLSSYLYLKNIHIHSYIFLFLSFFCLIFAFIKPSIFKIPNIIWSKLGIFMGIIISPIVLLIIYCFLVTPIGLFMKLLGKDLLNEKINKKKQSYWTKRINQMNNMKDQF